MNRNKNYLDVAEQKAKKLRQATLQRMQNRQKVIDEKLKLDDLIFNSKLKERVEKIRSISVNMRR